MAKFRFRFQKLLEYRQKLEGEAKDLYLGARARRVSGEEELMAASMRRFELAGQTVEGLMAMSAKQAAITRMQEEERHMRIALQVLEDEEAAEKGRWLAAKRDADAIDKLRERSLDEWQKEELKKEQAELDEWAVMRRAA